MMFLYTNLVAGKVFLLQGAGLFQDEGIFQGLGIERKTNDSK